MESLNDNNNEDFRGLKVWKFNGRTRPGLVPNTLSAFLTFLQQLRIQRLSDAGKLTFQQLGCL